MKYRDLEIGEVIPEGAECFDTVEGIWVESDCEDEVLDEQHWKHRIEIE